MKVRKKRYAIVGLGSRSRMYWEAICGDLSDAGELAALCDINMTRMEYTNRCIGERFGRAPIPCYTPVHLERMLQEQDVDTLIVTTVDRTHHDYITRALTAGCDAITEKPMTTTVTRCAAILEAIEKTGRSLRVAFNYRYAPRNSRVKELLMKGVVGRILSVHFEWLLDTKHGADYFRRWHRDKLNSGGLMVHKSTHHFDLVNWWLDSRPESVFASGGLKFYGRENAERRGITRFYDRGTGNPNAVGDPFALDLAQDPNLKALYLDAEHEDGYRRDMSVFSDGISIEDDVAVIVNYECGAVMSYHLTAYSPWEGFRVAFNGTKGRLEYEVVAHSYVSGSEADANRPDVRDGSQVDIREEAVITIRPHWEKPTRIVMEKQTEGGHGGADKLLLRDLFIGDGDDPLQLRADHCAGVFSIITGIAANRSIEEKRLVRIRDLLRETGREDDSIDHHRNAQLLKLSG
jgi:predicted dehydrogenase